MATAGSKQATCSIVEYRTFELETEAGSEPAHTGVVMMDGMLLVVDWNSSNLQVYNGHDGKLITSHRLESRPCDICLISEIEVAVGLLNGPVVIMSLKSIDDIKLVKTLKTGFDSCRSLAKWNSEKLIVSGWKDEKDGKMLCWGILSITDGRMDPTHDICKGYRAHMAIKDDTVYISCYDSTTMPTTDGVYSYDILNPHTQKFLYQHQELKRPWSIMADRDCVYVCDLDSNRIHQLTDRGQLLTIHTVSSDLDKIFYDDQLGLLYTTRNRSNVITVYKIKSLHQQGVPIEILKMDDRSIQLFEEALKDGKETVHSIRILVVGHMGVGKTTLVKRLLGEKVKISERHSTEGIDVYVNCCDVSLSTQEWTRRTKDSEQDYKLQRLVKVLNENYQAEGRKVDSQPDASSNQRETTDGNPLHRVADDNKNTGVLYRPSQQQKVGQNLSTTSSLQNESSSPVVQIILTHSEINTIPGSELGEKVATENYKMDPLREMLKVLQQNPNKAKQDISKHAQLTILDFAGQYAFYTTHQMFLTRRAIYLLVLDASKEVIDLVEDDFYFDSEGILKRKVHDLVQVWMNSIHSCALPDKKYSNSANSHTSSYKVIPPPVILVGTHIDQIPQNLPTMVGNYGGQSLMPGFLSSSNPGLRSPIDYDVQAQRKRPSMFGKFLRRFRRNVSSGGDNPDARKPLKYDVQTEQDSRHKLGQRYLKEIRSYLRDKPTTVHLVDEDFAIDNTILDSKLEELKKKIVEVASQQPYWGEQIPTRWFLLEQQLMMLRDAGVKLVSYSTVENLNKEGTVRIEKSVELDLFLRYLHETGTIIYFSIRVLRDNIILDPKWMIDALKFLINAQPNLPDNPADNNTESNSPAASTTHSDITQKWSDFKEKGILTVELVDAIWTKENHPDLHEHKEHILMIMEQLNILAKPRSFNEMGEKVEKYFLTPCMLRQESPREFDSLEQDIRLESTPVLCWVFRGSYLPPPIFHRLIAACITRWPVAKKKETSEHLIFCGCCVFDLDLFHRLTLYSRKHIVFARITRLVIDEIKTPEARLCTRVRKFITLNLSKITSCLDQNLQYELRTQWPPSRGDSEDNMVGLSPPFEMWLADEGHDPDAAIMPEHMNYARLGVALITVCGNALRKILQSKFPVPYADIYQVILANRLKLINRPGRPLLNRDQIRLLFPDPHGNKVGTLDHFDISLLYILIRNVSTVPEPITGWNMDPCDQPRDTSLEASVERIHSYRNHITGHNADGMISRKDFEDYWNKFEAVICDIEAILGEQVCSQQLDKQRRQVITIYEAC